MSDLVGPSGLNYGKIIDIEKCEDEEYDSAVFDSFLVHVKKPEKMK